ncbi:MAG: hypothetical protein ACLGHL_03405 [Actinomycetota bacterium]
MITLSKSTTGDKLAGVCAILLLITPFLKMWGKYSYEIDLFGVQQSESTGAALIDGDAFTAIFAWLIVLAALAAVGVFARRMTAGEPSDPSTLYMALGGAMFVLLLIMFLQGPKDFAEIAGDLSGVDFEGLGGGVNLDTSRGILMFLGPLLALGVVAGGFMTKNQASATGPVAPPAAA